MKRPKIKESQGIAKYLLDVRGISALVTGISALVKNNIDILKFVFPRGAENKQEEINIVENNTRQTLLTTLNTKSEYFYQSNKEKIFVNSETGELSEENADGAITYLGFIDKSMEENRGGRPQFRRDLGKEEKSNFARSQHALRKRFGAESVTSGVGTTEKDIEESLDSEVIKLEKILDISKKRVLGELKRVLDKLRKKFPEQVAKNIWGQLEEHVQNPKVNLDQIAKYTEDDRKVKEILTETLKEKVEGTRVYANAKTVITDCLEEVEKQIELKQELAKAKKKTNGTVIYFPPNEHKIVENSVLDNFLGHLTEDTDKTYRNSIAYEYPQRVGLDRMIEDIVADIKTKIIKKEITHPIKIHGMSIGGMVGSEVAKKLCEQGFMIAEDKLEVHNTSRSLSKLVSSFSLIPEGILSILIKIGLGQNLETEKNIEYLASMGVSTNISATKGDKIMQGDASFIHSERDDGVNIPTRILRIIHRVNGVEYKKNILPNFLRAVVDLSTFVGLVAVNVIAVPVMMLIAIDRLSTRLLKNKNNEYAFRDKILEYKEGEPISNIARFAGRFTLKTLAFSFAAIGFSFLIGRDIISSAVGKPKPKQNPKHVVSNGITTDTNKGTPTIPLLNHPAPDNSPQPGQVSLVQFKKITDTKDDRHNYNLSLVKNKEEWQEETMVWKRKQESRRNHMQRITKAWEGVTKIMRKGSRKKP